MSEQELIFNVKELHVISLTCSECGHGTIFDFKSSDYLDKSVSPVCSICKTELMVDLQEQLKSYRCFYDSMSRCERVEFRVRLQTPEVALTGTAAESAAAVSKAAVVSATALSATAAETAMAVSAAAEESAIKVKEMVSTAVAEVQQVAIAAAATTIESTTEVQHMVSTALAQVHEMTSTAVNQVQAAVVKILAREQDVSKFGEPSFWARKHGTESQQK